jgi:predicted GNAT superfamily acetyltransferase
VAFYFHPNHYGEMTDALNRGLASDRLEATWYTSDDELPDLHDDGEQKTPLVTASEVHLLPQNWDAPAYTLEIPQDLNDLKQRDLQAAAKWQTAVREALTAAFAQGYAAVDFQTQAARCYYVLRRHAPHF